MEDNLKKNKKWKTTLKKIKKEDDLNKKIMEDNLNKNKTKNGRQPKTKNG